MSFAHLSAGGQIVYITHYFDGLPPDNSIPKFTDTACNLGSNE